MAPAPGRATPYRPEGADNLKEEFREYGLPEWARWVVGTLKLTFAALLIVGLILPEVTPIAAAGMGLLMIGAVVAHLRVGDPLAKSVPALKSAGTLGSGRLLQRSRLNAAST